MTAQQIVWKCAACSLAIFGDTGYLQAPYREIGSSGPVHWTAVHDACHPDDGYSIDVVSLASPAQVLGWTAHLAGKTWYARSDWRALMAAHGVDVSSEESTLEVTPDTRRNLDETPSVVGPW